MYRISSPQDFIYQLISLRRRRTSPDRIGENSVGNRELLELVLTFDANSDASSDNDGDTTSQDDLFG